MREWINILDQLEKDSEGKRKLDEADRPYKEKEDERERTSFDFDFGPTSKGEVSKGQTKQDIDPSKVKQSSKAGNRSKLSKAARNPNFQRSASQMAQNVPDWVWQQEEDPEEDEQGYTYAVEPEPEEPENLPARQSQEVAEPDFEPEWIKVKDLPGYVVAGLRQIANSLFNNILPTRNFGQLNFISTLTHGEDEVKVVAKWVQQNAMKDDDAFFDVEVIPGYTVRAQLYRTDNANFLVAKDWMNNELAGHYVYMWEGGRGTDVGSETGQKKRVR